MEAPVSASEGAMRSLPMKLESLLSGPEQGLQAEEKQKLRILQVHLQRLIDNYLLEPSEVESPASTASSWMEGVRDLSYDIDDFIYELAHVAGGGGRINFVQKPPRFKISRFSEKLRRRQWITDDISGFKTRVKEAIRRHRDYLGSNCKWRPSSSGQSPPPSSPSGEAPIHLVGVDSSIEQLCSWLVNDGQPEHKVASIVGAGGVGKTILAKQVYRKLGVQFECLAFVRASPKADMKGLLTSILSQVRRHRLPDDACDVHNLVLNINAHLQDKTYLIIIEDLWALSTWDLINHSLPKGNRCSRILTTTEVEVIAQACCADNSKCIPAKKEDDSRYIIRKKTLSEYESRELFLSTAFGKQAECPQHLKEVSNEIIKRSGGLPLAINILASLLARRQPASSIEQWSYIKNSLSSTLTTNASLERINQVLNLGYDNLPHGMKACMLYLCLYEEGCVIWKDDLVKQWIAEGFIGAVKGHEAEEVARSYFGELVNRGMIQPVDINCNDEILSCTVHHMVLHFIRDKSMEENFCIAVDHSQTTIRLVDKVRRLALHFGNVEDAMPPGPESMRLSKLRSVAFSGFPKCMPSIVDFRFLQVLILKLLVEPDKMSDNLTGSEDLSGSITEPDDLSYNLTEISELFRLRYFHLDACHMSVALPTQMQRLKDLVAWEIDAEVTAVPSDIVDLPGLLYLSIPSNADLPVGIGRMTSLCTLGVFDLSKNSTETVMSLGELTNLQELRLTCSTLQPGNLEKNLECLGVIVRKLRNLKRVTLVPAVSSLVNTQDDGSSSSMSISWLDISIQPLPLALLQTLELSRRCCIFSSLPIWTKELTKLCILKIAVRKLSREDVAILKGLLSLAALSLFVWTAPARSIMFDDEGFSVLRYFKFVCNTPCLVFLDGTMPNVRKLKLGFNANRLKGLDAAGFGRLTGLNEISIKIGGTGACENNRKFAQLVLTTAICEHPSTPIINVQWVDWNFCGDEEMDIDPQKEMWKWTSAIQGMTARESSDEHAIEEKNLEEDANKQEDIRTYTPPESTMQNTDRKFSLINKSTDGIAEKREVDNDGYGDIFKNGQSMNYIPLHILEDITNGFSVDSIIGMSGSGNVYKGVYKGRWIAVKLLHVDTVQGLDEQQYINEVGNLLRVKHPNIVQLLAYSYEIKKKYVEHNGEKVFSQRIYRVLCFEYLQGGSLDKCLYDQSFAPNWSTRYNIIKGICEGLNFLHKCVPPILHLDLKPANILLDSSMEPKLADFGLSRLFTQLHTHVTERIIETRMYMPPEFINEGKVSPKNDVFSLGVVMIEIMTGRPTGYSNSIEMGDVTQLTQQVLTKWSTMIEATSKYRSEELHQVKTCIELAMHCVDSERKNRPTVADILDTLNKTETHIPMKQIADMLPFLTRSPKNTMAKRLNTMTAEVGNITNKHERCNFMPRDSFNINVQQVPHRETSSTVGHTLIIGRTEERREILSILSENVTKEMVILPIYGIGGIGKTTLAQLVFNDTQFQGYSRVWVYVSQEFDLKKIGNSIISQLTKEISHITDRQMLHNRLGELFAGKSILIVLDDLWEDKPYELHKLKAMLMPHLGNKVIIVTTRCEATAWKVSSNVMPYKLDVLTNDMCWTIIKQKSSFENQPDKKQLEQTGRDIAIKCGGVALVAQSLGYILRDMTSDQWESVRDSYIWNLSTFEDPSLRNQEVLASLLLSYSHMPECLKLCFSYCAVFPKGHSIVKYDLIHQWIALGFPEPSRIFDSMQLCEKYVTQLLGMSFLEYSKAPSSNGWQDNGVTLFTMHDLVHDLARAMLADKVNEKGKAVGSSCHYALLTDCSKPLQLSLSSPENTSSGFFFNLLQKRSTPENIKALFFLDSGKIELLGGAFSPAKCLRVLDLSECFIRKLPDCIGQLKQLRFLHAPYIQDKMIPNCITELSELSYLSIRGSRNISALPESIGDMKGLMHLDLSGCKRIRQLPVSFTELKQLVHLDLSLCNLSVAEALGGCTKLQYLNLSGCDGVRELPKSFMELKQLVHLDLSRWGMSISEAFCGFPKLQYMNLSALHRTNYVGGLLEIIRNLTKLRYLNLSRSMQAMARSDDEMGSLLYSINTLPNLEHLELS